MAQLWFSPAAARDLERISDDIAAASGKPVALAFVQREIGTDVEIIRIVHGRRRTTRRQLGGE